MNKQFTPGPWSIVMGVHEEATDLYDKGEKWFAVHNEDGLVAETLHGRCLDADEEQAYANAILIAAAPEMFELLQRRLEAPYEDTEKWFHDVEQLLTRITTV